VHDISVALKSNPEQTQTAINDMSMYLKRNNQPQKFNESMRLKHHLYIQPNIEALDSALASCSDFPAEATKGRRLLTDLEKCEGQGEEVADLLTHIVQQLTDTTQRDLDVFVERIMDCTAAHFPTLLPDIKSELYGPCKEKAKVDRSTVKRIIEESVKTNIERMMRWTGSLLLSFFISTAQGSNLIILWLNQSLNQQIG
jgi:hypothetical protein